MHSNTKRAAQGTTGRGFTIPEVLAVIALIIIILAMLLPTFQGTRHAAWRAECASNQHQIHIALQGNKMTTSVRTIPASGRWVTFVQENGAQSVLECPVGVANDGSLEFETDPDADKFEDLYSVQVSPYNPSTYDATKPADLAKTTFSYVSEIIEGHLATDPQLGRQWKGEFLGDFGEHGHGWPEAAWGQKFTDDEMAVTYNDDGGYMVQMSGVTTIYSLDAPGDTSCSSDHWVCLGESGVDWQGEVLMQLTGNNHKNMVDEPAEIGALGAAHYGMNNLVNPQRLRGDQILLMDYRKTIIRVNPTGTFLDDFDARFAPRHFDKANVMRVDGSISLMTRGELNANEPIWHVDPEP